MSDDEWENPKSSYGRVVESVDAIIRRHPSAGPQHDTGTVETPAALPENVVDLRPRLTAARSGGYPDDAA